MAVELSVRMTEAGWSALRRHSARHGLTFRAAVEGALEAFLEMEVSDPSPDGAAAALWARAVAIDAEHALGATDRVKQNLRLDDDLIGPLRAACARQGATLNGLIAAGLVPMRSWGTPARDEAMAACWERGIILARQREWRRRMGRSGRSDVPNTGCA